MATPVMWLSESATLLSGNLPSSSALIESCTTLASRLSSVERARLPRTPVTATVASSVTSPRVCVVSSDGVVCESSAVGALAGAAWDKAVAGISRASAIP